MKLLKRIGGILLLALIGFGAWTLFFHHASDLAGVEGGPEIVTEVAVKTAPLVKTTLRKRVAAFGQVQPEPASGDQLAAIAMLALSSPGLIAEVRCVEGQAVEKGDVLVTLDSRVDEGRLKQARASLEFATQGYERQRKLLSIEGASEKSVQSAQNDLDKARLEVAASETALALLRIEAPISGIVSKVNVRKGEAADPSKIAVEILDPNRLVLAVQIPADQAGEIEMGQAAAFYRHGNLLPGDGDVTFVSPGVNGQTGAAEVRLSLPPQSGVLPGEWLEARIVSQEKRDVLAAPVASVTGENGSVIALVRGDTATQVPVEQGLRDGDWVEIQGKGIAEGDMVVTQGAYGLPQETKVRIIAP